MNILLNDNQKINIRVGAFIYDLSNNYVLIHKKINNDYWILPGGRLEFCESTDEAIKREIYEEVGYNLDFNLVMILENFYTINNVQVHELDFDFLGTYNEIIKEEHTFHGLEGEYMIFKWVHKNNIKNYNFIIPEEREFLNLEQTDDKKIMKYVRKRR